MVFPPLPKRDPPWPSPVIIAAGQIYNAYATTTRLVKSGNYNHYRITAHKHIMYHQVQPLIRSITTQEAGLKHWVSDVSQIIFDLHEELEKISADQQ